MKNFKKVLIILLILIIIVVVALFAFIYGPNYKKSEFENKVNLVINYTNVTGRMKGEAIVFNGKIYISKEDIKNYYDDYIYYEQKKDAIIISNNGKYVYFDIKNGSCRINDEYIDAKVLVKNDVYYIPISELEDVYNIKVEYKPESRYIVIDSLDREQKSAKVLKECNVKSNGTIFSRTIQKQTVGEKVYIVQQDKKVSIENNTNQDIKRTVKNKVLELRNNTKSDKWVKIRTESGKIGYIEKKYLSQEIINRKETEKKEIKKVSLIWDYFNEQAKAPTNTSDVKYTGINVVSPSFFYLENGKLESNIGNEGYEYIKWAKANGYEVWPMVANNNNSEEKIEQFSKLINDYDSRQELIIDITEFVEQYSLDGINIDFENINKSDKQALSRFIIELKPRLEKIGAKLSVDVTEPDGSDRWSLCFDRHVIGDVADYIVFMAYDQYGTYSKTAGSTAAYNWVEKNINKFIKQEEVEPNKIILGIPLYTRLWKESTNGITSTVISIKNIKKYIPGNAQIRWLENEKQSYVEYTKDDCLYKMWIEDEDSIEEKMGLVVKYELSGVAFWQKGYETEPLLKTIDRKFKSILQK